MNKLGVCVAVSMLAGLCAPLAAHADDIVTLAYQSAVLTGTYTYLPTGLTSAAPSLPSASFSGTIAGSVVFDETEILENHFVGPISYSFTLSGVGASVSFASTAPALVFFGNCAGSENCIGLTADDGVVTGATVGLLQNSYHAPESQLSIGLNGDSASFVNGDAVGTCMLYEVETYTGPTVSPCRLNASSSTAGTWTVSNAYAPEIDPASAGSGLTLLAGSLAMMRGRKRATA
jgi:hypothetical protein